MIGLYFCFCGFSQKPLAPTLTPGTTAKYRVSATVTEFAGAGSKASGSTSTELPIEIRVGASHTLGIVSGPLVARGRSVGRSRRSLVSVDGGGGSRGQAPAQLFVVYPKDGVTPGQTWKAGFFGPSPLFAGLQATYKFVQVTPDKRFARIDLKVEGSGAGRVRGSGTLYVRFKDGYLDHGTAKFDISYLRPDMKDRSKMIVNNHVSIDCKVTQR